VGNSERFRIVDVLTGELVAVVHAPAGDRIAGGTFDSSGRNLLLATSQGSGYLNRTARAEVRIWREPVIFRKELLQKACEAVTRPLNEKEWKIYLPEDPSYRNPCEGL
jgi:hypothetical protein